MIRFYCIIIIKKRNGDNMLTKNFYRVILIEFETPSEFSEALECDEEFQMRVIKSTLAKKHKKPIAKIISLRKIKNEYLFLHEREENPDYKSEYQSMIKKIDRLIRKLEKSLVSDYDDFSKRLFDVLEIMENKYEYHNALTLLLLSYEGIRENDLINICLKDFYIRSDKKKAEYLVNVNEIPVPVHKKTYDYITEMSETYELTYKSDEKRKNYSYYSYIRNKNWSVWKTKISECELTDENFFSLRKNLHKYLSEFGIDAEKAYRYGRYEVIFRLELNYEKPEKLMIKMPSGLFRYAVGIFYDLNSISKDTLRLYRNEYLEWRKQKIFGLE